VLSLRVIHRMGGNFGGCEGGCVPCGVILGSVCLVCNVCNTCDSYFPEDCSRSYASLTCAACVVVEMHQMQHPTAHVHGRTSVLWACSEWQHSHSPSAHAAGGGWGCRALDGVGKFTYSAFKCADTPSLFCRVECCGHHYNNYYYFYHYLQTPAVWLLYTASAAALAFTVWNAQQNRG
jgi:hypothetical protein